MQVDDAAPVAQVVRPSPHERPPPPLPGAPPRRSVRCARCKGGCDACAFRGYYFSPALVCVLEQLLRDGCGGSFVTWQPDLHRPLPLLADPEVLRQLHDELGSFPGSRRCETLKSYCFKRPAEVVLRELLDSGRAPA